MDGFLHPLIRIGQTHQQLEDASALSRTVGGQLVGSCRSWLIGILVMLLTPYRRLPVCDNLGCKNTLDTFVEGLLRPLSLLLVSDVALVRFALLSHLSEHIHRIHHSTVVIRDMHLITLRIRPELRPSAIFILSAEQIVDTFAECISIALFTCSLIQTGKVGQLHVRSSIIGVGVILSLFVFQHLSPLPVIQRFDHIDIFWPSASDALVQ